MDCSGDRDIGRPPFIGVWRSGLPKEAAGQCGVECSYFRRSKGLSQAVVRCGYVGCAIYAAPSAGVQKEISDEPNGVNDRRTDERRLSSCLVAVATATFEIYKLKLNVFT